MTTLIGLMDGKSVILGCDSRATTLDGDIKPISGKKYYKNKDYIFAYAGSVRGGQILMPQYFIPPKNVWELPDAIRQHCEEKSCLGATEGGFMVHGCNYLVIHKHKLYVILNDFQMDEVENYYSVGSGDVYAFSSLNTTECLVESKKLVITPEERVTIALNCSAKFDSMTGGPFIVNRF